MNLWKRLRKHHSRGGAILKLVILPAYVLWLAVAWLITELLWALARTNELWRRWQHLDDL